MTDFLLKYNIGDVLVDEKPESPLYRRDSIVVFTDPIFVGIVTEGIPRIVFIATDEKHILCKSKGSGKLSPAIHEQITAIVKEWPDAEFLKSLPQQMDNHIKQFFDGSTEKIPITITGFIAKPLAIQWRRYTALAYLARDHGIDIPNDIESRIIEWMLTSTIPNIPFLQNLKRYMEDRGGPGHGDPQG